jgi:hypothetical protein
MRVSFFPQDWELINYVCMNCDNFESYRKGYKIQFKKKNMISSKKYMIMSIGLSAIFVMAIMPNNVSTDAESKFFGAAEMTMYDTQGNEKFTQTVHNRLLDIGENYLLMGAFRNGTTIADATSLGSICLTNGTLSNVETITAADFDGYESLTTNNCKIDTDVAISGGTAVIGPLNFEAGTGGDNVDAGTTIKGIGICESSGSADFNDCATNSGILFAQVATSDVTLQSGESVDVTYTFDISSDDD